MAISDKLNYLIETKQLFKDRLNSLGAEIIESTTFRNYLNWLDNMYNKISDKTDLAKNGIVGRTSQETTTGKNLLPVNIANNTTTNGITFTKLEDGSYSMNGTSTRGNIFELYTGGDVVLPSGTYTGSFGNRTNIIGVYIRKGSGDYQTLFENTDTNTFTINSDFTYDRIYMYIPTGKTFTNQIIKPMLEQGSTATSYEPYGPSPNPDFPQEIKNLSGDISYKVSGNGISRTFPLSFNSKNLFDKDNANILNNAYLNNSQSKIASGNGNKILYISIEGGKTYTISKIASSRFAVATTSVLPSINTTTIDKKQNNDATSITLATSLNAKYLCVFYLYSADTINEQEILNSIQIEQNSTATDFEPYYDIELCEINNYKDKIYSQDGKFYLHKEIEKISGTVNWVVNSIASNNRAVIPLTRIGYPLAISGYSVEQCLSNYFQKTSQQEQSSSTEINTISANNDNIYIKFDSSINTTSLAKTKLDSMTDLIIYYPPVTPTTTEITEENYPTLYNQLKDILDYLTQYKINNEFLLDYSSPEIEY